MGSGTESITAKSKPWGKGLGLGAATTSPRMRDVAMMEGIFKRIFSKAEVALKSSNKDWTCQEMSRLLCVLMVFSSANERHCTHSEPVNGIFGQAQPMLTSSDGLKGDRPIFLAVLKLNRCHPAVTLESGLIAGPLLVGNNLGSGFMLVENDSHAADTKTSRASQASPSQP